MQFVANGEVTQVVTFFIEKEIRAVYMILNPDKLARGSLAHVN